MEWMLMPLRRYTDFSGRSRRMEYWMFFLGYVIVAVVFGVLFMALGGRTGTSSTIGGVLGLLLAVVALGLVVPSIALQVRRFHDQDKSGWMILLNFVPYIGGIIVLVFMCIQGTQGPNRYGDDPVNPDGHLSDVFQ